MGKRRYKYSSITRDWGGIEVKREFDDKIDLWLEQFDENERDVLLELLKHFKYYSSQKLKEKVIELYQRFLDEYEEDSGLLTFIPVYKEYGVGFSDEFFNKFWLINDIYDSAEKNVYSLLEEGESFDKIVILDDYSGSGKTLVKTIRHYLEASKSDNSTIFYVLVIEMSKIAYDKILNYAEEQGLNIRIISLQIHDKAFEKNNIFMEEELEINKEKYSTICFNHNVLASNYWGFDKTEALVSFEYNTPNNTLGLFWYEGEDFFAIFRRHKKKNTTLAQMKKDVKKRKREREKNLIRVHNEDENYIFLMIYLVNQDYNFNYQNACGKFGMSEEQMDKAIAYLLYNEYVSLAGGKITPTPKLKELIKISKISDIKNDTKEFEEKSFRTNIKYIPKDFNKTFSGY